MLVTNHFAFISVRKVLILIQVLDFSQNVLAIFKCKTVLDTVKSPNFGQIQLFFRCYLHMIEYEKSVEIGVTVAQDPSDDTYPKF